MEKEGEERRGLILPFLLPILLVGIITGATSLTLFSCNTFNNDIPGYVFGAETLASGRLLVPAQPLPFFRTWMVVNNDGKMYSRYMPGHPLVLAVCSALLRNYRLVPPVLAMLGALLLYLLVREVAGLRAARCAVWLPILSPFYLYTGSTLLSHGSCLVFLATGCLGYALIDSRRQLRWGWLAGTGFGMAMATRPLTGLAFTAAVILVELAKLKREQLKQLPARWLPMFIPAAVIIILVLGYNYRLTGSMTELPFQQYWTRDKLGFQENLGRDVVGQPPQVVDHTLARGLRNLRSCYASLDRWMLLIPFGASLALLLGLYSWWRNRGSEPLFILQTTLMLGLYILFYSRGLNSGGPIYYYELALPLMVLAGMGLPPLADRILSFGRTKAVLALLALAAVTLVYLPSRSFVFSNVLKKQLKETRQRQRLKDCVSSIKTPALVFLPEKVFYVGQPFGHLINDPLLENRIIFAIQPEDPKDIHEIHKSFSSREIYLLRFSNPSLSPRQNDSELILEKLGSYNSYK